MKRNAKDAFLRRVFRIVNSEWKGSFELHMEML